MNKGFLYWLLLYALPGLGQHCECPPGLMTKLKFIDAPREKWSDRYFLCVSDPEKVEKNGVYYAAHDFAVVFCAINDMITHHGESYSPTIYVKNDTLFLVKTIAGIPSLYVARGYRQGNNVKITYTYNSQKQVTKKVEYADFEKLDKPTIQVLITSFHEAVNALKTDENSRFISGTHINNMLICALNGNKEAEKIIMNFDGYLSNPKGKIVPAITKSLHKLVLLNMKALLVELR